MKKIAILTIIIFSSFLNINAQEVPNLFLGIDLREMEIDTINKPETFKNVKRAREIKINQIFQETGYLNVGDNFSINLFDDAVYSATVKVAEVNVNGTYIVSGFLEDNPFAYFIIVTTNGISGLRISLPYEKESYSIINDSFSESLILIQKDLEEIERLIRKNDLIDIDDQFEVSVDELERLREAAKLDTEDWAVIDILVVYTSDAENSQNVTDEGGIENYIALQLQQANSVLEFSETNANLNLVYSKSRNYAIDNDLEDLLNYMKKLDTPLHKLRNEVGADLVSLFHYLPGEGAVANGLYNPNGNSKVAFSIFNTDILFNEYAFIHEIGHNLGAGHHKMQNHQPGPQLFEYSAGWRWSGDDNMNYLSVMSYDGLWADDLYAPLFSNPNINYQGVPAGYFTESGDTLNADNARTIRETKHIVAAYRRRPTRYYVSEDGDDGNTGRSWESPYKTLTRAIAAAKFQTNLPNYQGETYEVWVKGGTYYPTKTSTITLNNRRRHLRMASNVEIYGGFLGNESILEDRDIAANPTIINGDINQSGDTNGNVYHVFYHSSELELDHTAVLDGFIIKNGYADGNMAWPNPYNSEFARGAGMKNEPGNNPTIRNVIFTNNQAVEYGGAMYNDNSNPTLINIEFIENSAVSGGALFNANGSNPEIINSTLFANSASDYGGGIYNQNSSVSIVNSILWNNTAPGDPQISNFNSTSDISFSLVQGGHAGEGNLDEDPMFVDQSNGDFEFDEISPLLESGTNYPFQPNGSASNVFSDIKGSPRIRGLHVDIGARENQAEQDIPFTVNVTSIDAKRHPWVYTNLIIEVEETRLGHLDKSNFEIFENGIKQNFYEVVPPSQGGGVRRADIIFIMDNSGSMSPYQNSVAANVTEFVNNLTNSGVDFALGLTRYGQSAYSGNPIIEDNGQLTSNADYFLQDVWSRNVDNGGTEPGYYAIVQSANGFAFRPGAQKIFIIITDETPNQGGASLTDALNASVNNSITLFAITETSLFSTFSPITVATNGGLYDFYADYNDILNSISESVGFSYTLYFKSNDNSQGTQRDMEIVVSYGGNQGIGEASYTSGSYQVISLAQSTVESHQDAIESGNPFIVEVEITDYIEPYTQQATLYYKNTGDNDYQSIAMLNNRSGITSNWTAQIPANQISAPGIDYYITSSDGELTSSLPTVDAHQNPIQISVLPNESPEIIHEPVSWMIEGEPLLISTEVIDTTDYLESVLLKFRKSGQLIFQETEMIEIDDNQYSAYIPGEYVTDWGVEYYIFAKDNENIQGYLVFDNEIVNSDNPISVVESGCYPPESLVATNISTETAILNWQTPAGSQWDLIWGPFGFNPDNSGNLIENITDKPYILTGLEHGTNYSFSVRNKCGNLASSWAWPVSFSTEQLVFNITSTAGENGSIEPVGDIPVVYGESKIFTIQADECYFIEDILVNGLTIEGAIGESYYIYTFENISENQSIHASFQIYDYVLSYDAGENGQITGENSQTVNCGFSGTPVEAVPDEGYHFVQWDDGVTQNPRTDVNVTHDINVTAEFAINLYTITASPNDDDWGIVTGSGEYEHGDLVNLMASANLGYAFLNWKENGNIVSQDFEYNFTAFSNRNLVAVFNPVFHSISLSVNPAGAGGAIGGGNYQYGSEITISASANEGWEFLYWEENDNVVSESSEYTFTVTSDRSIIARFSPKEYVIEAFAQPAYAGIVDGQGYYEHGSVVTIIAIPNPGWYFVNWFENGIVVSQSGEYTFIANSDRSLIANFNRTYCDLNAIVQPLNSGIVNGTGSYPCDTVIALIAVPSSGYHFKQWTLDGDIVSQSPIEYFSPGSSGEIIAHFVNKDYILLSDYLHETTMESGFVQLTVTADQPWVATPERNWLSVYPNYGNSGSSEVMVSWMDNTDNEIREAAVVFHNEVADASFSVTQEFSVSVPDIDPDEILVFPNPAKDGLNIHNIPHGAHFFIADVQGSEVLRVEQTEEKMFVDVSFLHPGFYNLIVVTRDRRIVKKVILF